MVRFGILGAGNIAHRFARSLKQVDGAELVAASCRTSDKAHAFLSEVPHGEDARAYGDHAQLLADTRVDAVYLSLPHALHKEWVLRALRSGKAVLCEKPAMLSAREMEEVAELARTEGVLFMEAMKPRFVPLYAQVREAAKQIGPIVHVDATLCNDMLGFVEGSGSYHMTPGPGAGVLLDCGIYCASWIAAFCPGGLTLASVAGAQKDAIDIYVDARLVGEQGTARLECAFDRAKPRTATLVGERGCIVVEELHRPQRAVVYVDGEEPRVLDAPYEVDDFFGEIRHFVDLVQEGLTESPRMSLDDSISCARILDSVSVTKPTVGCVTLQRGEAQDKSGDSFERAVQARYERITRALIATHTTISTMESCTAGQLASLLTDTEGASAILKGAFVTYCNEAKVLQGVPAEVIERYGVYSPETAVSMAEACRRTYAAHLGVGVTGSFGNVDPNNEDSVPGEVYFALASPETTQSFHATIPPQPSRFAYKLFCANALARELERYLELDT